MKEGHIIGYKCQAVNLLLCTQVPSSICYIFKASKCQPATSYHAYKTLHQYVTFLRPQSADLLTSYHAYKFLHQFITFLQSQSANLPTSYLAYKSLHQLICYSSKASTF